jgi:N-acetyl-gamma-glutamylphosphate reductase
VTFTFSATGTSNLMKRTEMGNQSSHRQYTIKHHRHNKDIREIAIIMYQYNNNKLQEEIG